MLAVSDHTPAAEALFLMLVERTSVDIRLLKPQRLTIGGITRRASHERKTIRA